MITIHGSDCLDYEYKSELTTKTYKVYKQII